ncbi:MAG: Ldh family oxidoreductase [Ruminococcaceae bacterium]|nr:Ldh family oxidoreductase [Oscillospiraceae bacterium]
MGYVRYSVEALERFCNDAFIKFGFTREEAAEITDVLILAELYGIQSHGTQRLVRYHKSIENGCVRIDAKPEIVFETPVSAVIDGHAAMGQLTSVFAMKKAIEKAKKVGVAFVTVRNSNHYGIAGYYTKMACDQGLIGISATNTESIMVHTGSRQAVLGSNPIAFAMPAEPYPFWFDAATTVIPKGKLEVYHKADKELPSGWAVDSEGRECHIPEDALMCIDKKTGTGGILPIGGISEESGSHKGYGFSMICEILCSITSSGATSNHHKRVRGEGSGTCHSFIAIDPAIFGDTEEIKKNLSVFLEELRSAKRIDENIPIYTHGEKEILSYEKRLREGIDVDISTVGEMAAICKYLGMDTVEYLGDVDLSSAKETTYTVAAIDK